MIGWLGGSSLIFQSFLFVGWFPPRRGSSDKQKGFPSFLDFSDAFQHKGVTERKTKPYGRQKF